MKKQITIATLHASIHFEGLTAFGFSQGDALMILQKQYYKRPFNNGERDLTFSEAMEQYGLSIENVDFEKTYSGHLCKNF